MSIRHLIALLLLCAMPAVAASPGKDQQAHKDQLRQIHEEARQKAAERNKAEAAAQQAANEQAAKWHAEQKGKGK